jgi:phenylacetate-CoA ligase
MSESYDFVRQSKARRFYRNVAWFDAFNMTEKRMKSFTDFLIKFEPSLIIGYVSALYEYARFLVGNTLSVPPPKAVCLTAEPSDYSQRELIEAAFGARTYDEYGSTEILRIAAECGERTGLHVHADSRYVEIVNSQGKHACVGEIGEVIVTDLENKVMPLIRYRGGDMSSWHGEDCRCGIGFPLMNPVRGRTYDMITLKNGKKIYGHMFSRVLFGYVQEIRQFQVYQHTLRRIKISIVPGNMHNPERTKSEILRRFKQYTGEQIDYSYDLVSNIAREKSGKLRYVKSDVVS